MPKPDAKRLRDAIQAVADRHPERLSFTTELVGPGFWRVRKGDWRAIYHLTAETLTVVKVGNRRNVYDD